MHSEERGFEKNERVVCETSGDAEHDKAREKHMGHEGIIFSGCSGGFFLVEFQNKDIWSWHQSGLRPVAPKKPEKPLKKWRSVTGRIREGEMREDGKLWIRSDSPDAVDGWLWQEPYYYDEVTDDSEPNPTDSAKPAGLSPTDKPYDMDAAFVADERWSPHKEGTCVKCQQLKHVDYKGACLTCFEVPKSLQQVVKEATAKLFAHAERKLSMSVNPEDVEHYKSFVK